MNKSTEFNACSGLYAAIILVGACATATGTTTLQFGGPDASKVSMPKATAARNAFLQTLGWHGVENLETLSGRQNPTLTFGATGVTAQTGFPSGVFSQFAYSVSGFNFALDTEGVDDWLTFSQPITAFGSFIVQAGDGASAPPTSTPPNTLTLRLENTSLGTSKDVVVGALGPDWDFLNVIFIGVTDTQPFNRISFHESYDRDGLLWDDLIAGNLTVGDFNSDGMVDGGDLSLWREHAGASGNSPYANGDGDGDGDVDGNDLLVWQRQQGATAAPAARVRSLPTVPEPAAAILLVTTAVLSAGATRRAKN